MKLMYSHFMFFFILTLYFTYFKSYEIHNFHKDDINQISKFLFTKISLTEVKSILFRILILNSLILLIFD